MFLSLENEFFYSATLSVTQDLFNTSVFTSMLYIIGSILFLLCNTCRDTVFSRMFVERCNSSIPCCKFIKYFISIMNCFQIIQQFVRNMCQASRTLPEVFHNRRHTSDRMSKHLTKASGLSKTKQKPSLVLALCQPSVSQFNKLDRMARETEGSRVGGIPNVGGLSSLSSTPSNEFLDESDVTGDIIAHEATYIHSHSVPHYVLATHGRRGLGGQEFLGSGSEGGLATA